MKTRRRCWLAAALILVLAAGVTTVSVDERVLLRLIRADWARGGRVFEVKPYLQLGDARGAGERSERYELLWQTADGDNAAWSVDVRAGAAVAWSAGSGAPKVTRVAVDGVAPFRLYRASLTGLEPGGPFAYRVRRAGAVVFEADGTARKPAGTPHRFVVFGDGAAGTVGQSAVAYQTYRARPDYVVVTGDVVYMRGRASEYLDHFFPVYNSDRAGRIWGAPLLRSTPFLTAAGNHDLIERDLDTHPDGLAFYYYWAQPLNGPQGAPGSPGFPVLKGSPARRQAFLDAAGAAYPGMANYSFDYGDVRRPLDARHELRRRDPDPARRRHLRRHRRRRGPALQRRAERRPRVLAAVHRPARLEHPFADRRRRHPRRPDRPPSLVRRRRDRPIRRLAGRRAGSKVIGPGATNRRADGLLRVDAYAGTDSAM
ncbi:MAG: metallophosphoesterase [Planctomycetia bacterium]|nr:metallophosphoesterase [Planctomycetia bacterium]